MNAPWFREPEIVEEPPVKAAWWFAAGAVSALLWLAASSLCAWLIW